MKKYKQQTVPACTSAQWTGKKPGETRKNVDSYFLRYINGKCVTNIDKGITICFSKSGGKKLAFGGTIYPKKACLTEILLQVAKVATFSNFGKPKATDGDNVVGFLNFKCLVKIDGKNENIRFTVQLRNDGRFYYNHEVNIYKK